MPLALVVVLLASCGGGPRPPAVAPATRALVDAAERAERDRLYDRARALYRRAERTAPDPRSAGFAARKLALALLFWGEYRPARQALRRAVDHRPDDVASWHDLGIVDHQLGDLDAAEADFRRAIALAPREPRSRIALAALLWKQGRRAEAAAEYRALLGLDLPERVRAKVKWAISTLSKPVPPH